MPTAGMNIVGILNVTPDSFSDGGTVKDPLARIEELLTFGADFIDVGAESTRPGAVALTAEQEWARLTWLPEAARRYGNRLFLDSYHLTNAQQALDLGVTGINDVSGSADSLGRLAKSYQVWYVGMHRRGSSSLAMVPREQESFTIQQLEEWRDQMVAMMEGYPKLLLDPGLGFGKNAEDSSRLLKELNAPHCGSYPAWYVGASRKRFLAHLAGYTRPEDLGPLQREASHLAVVAHLLEKGVHWVRVHDVKTVVEFLKGWQWLKA